MPLDPGHRTVDPPRVGAAYIWLIVVATFGVYMAFITPIAISLAIRVAQLSPGHEEYLGYITGAGALAACEENQTGCG
ncbi:hypothetical protein [Actinomadura rugatobispora]|uniref:Uncharacterized protein n=1 Tax=Actinomadura rugatobispora TaxID=1994 RepID=A0ABW0ZY43_9ACTN